MGRKVARNKLLNNKQIKFYCNLEWRSKSKRLREKASRILFHDDFLIYYYKCPMSYEEISELD